jgi:hypothetical protein
VNRIAADTDTGRLADAPRSQLPHRLVCERTRARNHTDSAGFVNVTRHDADLASAGRNDPRTIRSNQPRFLSAHQRFHTHHVHHRNPLRDAHNELDSGIDRFKD